MICVLYMGKSAFMCFHAFSFFHFLLYIYHVGNLMDEKAALQWSWHLA